MAGDWRSHAIIVLLLTALVVLALAAPGCVSRYTKAFFLPGTMPEEIEFREKYTFVNFLPDQFHDWLVGVSVWSAWKDEDYKQLSGKQYDVSVLFVLPEDTVQQLRTLERRVDQIPREIRIDSLFVRFEPGGKEYTLPAISQRSRTERRVEFDSLSFPMTSRPSSCASPSGCTTRTARWPTAAHSSAGWNATTKRKRASCRKADGTPCHRLAGNYPFFCSNWSYIQDCYGNNRRTNAEPHRRWRFLPYRRPLCG
ncbi:hypothetical protein GF377_08875 [candidate division GN15 bacterium]|nr:hypothetical protein [candidate division GN15 bacterium]